MNYTCISKRKFETEADATAALVRINARDDGPEPKPKYAYKCEWCIGWHLTRQPPPDVRKEKFWQEVRALNIPSTKPPKEGNAVTIPLNYGDLPTEGTVLSESDPYQAELTRVALSTKLDKNNHMFCAVEVSIVDGDNEGKVLNRNYLRLPVAPKDGSIKEANRVKDLNEQFGRFCRAFKIQGTPPDLKFGDAESMARWHDFMSQFYGNRAAVTVKNEEYQGRVTSRLNDFIV